MAVLADGRLRNSPAFSHQVRLVLTPADLSVDDLFERESLERSGSEWNICLSAIGGNPLRPLRLSVITRHTLPKGQHHVLEALGACGLQLGCCVLVEVQPIEVREVTRPDSSPGHTNAGLRRKHSLH